MATDVIMAEPLPDLNIITPTDPDAQATVTDFVDYTELFPSDLIRSLTLIGKLDETYIDAAAKVHSLTKTFGTLPSLPADSRPSAALLRQEISRALDHAVASREAAFAEATRLLDVAGRHNDRLATIQRKLKELPQPPSRDPTPAPVSPQLARGRKQDADKALRLAFPSDAARHKAINQKKILVPGDVLPPGMAQTYTAYDSEDDEPARSPALSEEQTDIEDFRFARPSHQKKLAPPRIRIPKIARSRPSGDGIRSRPQFTSMSSSNALALLTPPPPDARPGSRFRPWLKLTDFEMAVLRKQMKKNAVWTPSDTMIRRELLKGGRGWENYCAAKAAAEAKGEPLLDEDPLDYIDTDTGPKETNLVDTGKSTDEATRSMETSRQENAEEDSLEQMEVTSQTEEAEAPSIRHESEAVELQTPERSKKPQKPLTESEQKKHGEQTLEEVNRKLVESTPIFQNLFSKYQGSSQEGSTRTSSRKRKRDPSKELTPSSLATTLSPNAQETFARPEVTKKPKLSAQSPVTSTHKAGSTKATSSSSPVRTTVVTRTEKVPLAPEGPSSSPRSSVGTRRQQTPRAPSVSLAEGKKPTSTAVQPTAAQSRPRRTSGSTRQASPTEAAPALPEKEEPKTPAKLLSPRPRSRSSAAARSIKAASAEPSSKKESRELRELRRASVVDAHPASDPATSATPASNNIRQTRGGRRPAPGVVTTDEDGKSKVSLGKRAAAPKKKSATKRDDKKENEEPVPDDVEDVDPNEPRYCICNDVSYGVMIACENDQCEKEWFHLPCVGLKEIPPRRSKWYCEDCRKQLRIDEKGRSTEAPSNTVPETRSGRR